MNYEALLEDEDNIFGGSPQSKFWDIVNQASDDLVKDQFDEFFQKFAIMEKLLENHYSEDEIENIMRSYPLENGIDLETHKKSLYVALTGDIVCRLDS